MATSTEARVGVFLFAALAVLVGFVVILGDFSFSEGKRLYVDFAYAGGLQAGAPVKVSGIKVGRVKRLALLSPGLDPAAAAPVPELGRQKKPVVRAELRLDDAAVPLLTQGARLAVGAAGVISEAYVELYPGETGAAALPEEVAVRGVDAAQIHVIALNVAGLLETLGGFTADEGEDTGFGVAAGRLLTTVNDILSPHKAELQQALVDLAASAKETRALMAELNQALGDDKLERLVVDSGATAAALKKDVPALVTQAKQGLAAMEALTREVDRGFSADEVLGIIADARRATKNLEAASNDARAMVASIKQGDGTIGGLVRDPQIYDDLKEMLRDLKRNPWKVFWRD